MPIITQLFQLGGEVLGQPLIEEVGIATDENDSRNQFARYEVGRVQLEPVPRARGLIAKDRDGVDLTSKVVSLSGDGLAGSYAVCLQVGPTAYQQLAPVQPFGDYKGYRLLTYSRSWVVLQI